MPRSFHVQHLLYEPRRSGISRHVLDLVRGLPELRHSVILPPGLAGVARELSDLGAEVAEVPLKQRGLPLSTWRKLPRLFCSAKADLIHLHALEAGLFGPIAAGLARKRRLVFTPQTVEIRRRYLLAPYRRLVRLGGERILAWIAVSQSQVEALRSWAPAGRIHYAPNTVPSPSDLPDRATARNRLGWPAERLLVASVGRLSEQKDPMTFLRAAGRLPQLQFVFVGAGPLGDKLSQLAATLDNVTLQGHVSTIQDVFAGADAIALTSLWEGLPYSLLEALSYGKAVVATRVPGNTDLVEEDETGLLFTPGDVEGLAHALERLAGDAALRTRLGQAGRTLVQRSFSPEEGARRLREVYESVL